MEPLEQRSALLERPKGAMDTACATGTPRRDHGTALALLERPGETMEQRLRYWNAPEGLTLCAKLAFQRS